MKAYFKGIKNRFLNSGSDKNDRRRGMTLLEVMIAALVLATLALGGGSALYHSRAIIVHSKNKRVAIDVATQRMELIRSIPYTFFPLDTDERFLTYNRNNFIVVQNSDPGELITINGRDVPLTTRFKQIQPPTRGSSTVGSCLEIQVRVDYRPGSGDYVELVSYYGR